MLMCTSEFYDFYLFTCMQFFLTRDNKFITRELWHIKKIGVVRENTLASFVIPAMSLIN